MPPPPTRLVEQSPGQGDLFAELAAMQPQQGAVSEGAVATAGVTQAVVGELATKKPDPGRAMDLLSRSISGLGGANKMDGLQRYATLERGEADLQERYGSKYWYVIGVAEGAGGALRRHAFYDYCGAAEAIAGRRLQRDDPAVALGFRAFAGVYGRVGRSAQGDRKKAITDLKRAKRDDSSKIPIKHFYDPDLEVYAHSGLNLTPEWGEVAVRITNGGDDYAEQEQGAEINTSVKNMLDEVLLPENGLYLLSENDSRGVINKPDGYAKFICSAVQTGRWRKNGGLTATLDSRQDALADAYKNVRKALGQKRKYISQSLEDFRAQSDVIDQLSSYISSIDDRGAYRQYAVTNRSLAVTIHVMDDLLASIASLRGFDDVSTARFANAVKAQLHDVAYASDFIPLLATYVDSKRAVLDNAQSAIDATLANYARVPELT